MNDLLARSERLLEELITTWDSAGLATKSRARQLAYELRNHAISLCFNKATEFSPDIERSYLLGAKLALLASGANWSELPQYEQHIYYYKKLKPSLVSDYESFKDQYT